MIGDNLCNTLTSLEFANWPNLEEIVVGSGSLTSIVSLNLGIHFKIFFIRIDNIPLAVLTVGENSFNKEKTSLVYSGIV